jgi:hypothetical protein
MFLNSKTKCVAGWNFKQGTNTLAYFAVLQKNERKTMLRSLKGLKRTNTLAYFAITSKTENFFYTVGNTFKG